MFDNKNNNNGGTWRGEWPTWWRTPTTRSEHGQSGRFTPFWRKGRGDYFGSMPAFLQHDRVPVCHITLFLIRRQPVGTPYSCFQVTISEWNECDDVMKPRTQEDRFNEAAAKGMQYFEPVATNVDPQFSFQPRPAPYTHTHTHTHTHTQAWLNKKLRLFEFIAFFMEPEGSSPSMS
jgi:hypothetical protein